MFPALAIWNDKVASPAEGLRVCSTVTVAEQRARGILWLLRGELKGKITSPFLAGPDHLETSFLHVRNFLLPFISCNYHELSGANF